MMNAEDKIITAKVRLQDSHPFFSYLIEGLKFKETKDIATMGVNGMGELFYNPEFLEKLDNESVKSVLAHEVMHVCLEHMLRCGKRDEKLFNIACDMVVNSVLIDNNFGFSGLTKIGSPIIPDYKKTFTIGEVTISNIDKKVAEEIYDELYPHAKEIKQHFKGFDSHYYSDGNEIESDGEANKLREDWKRRVAEAQTFSQQQGKAVNGMGIYIDSLLNPKMNWREILYKYISNQIPSDYNYSIPHKRSRVLNVFMPSLKREVLEVSVAVDVSGSINTDDLKEFLTEVKSIGDSFENISINLIFIDTQVNNHYVLNRHSIDELVDLAICGGGGTDFKDVYDYVAENIPDTKLLIFFTDGFADFPDSEEYKTIWVLTQTNNKENIPFGDILEL